MGALKLLASLLLLVGAALASQAQDETGYTSTVNWFYSACEDRMVIDFDGVMEAGYDLYFQAFDNLGGVGEPLTELRKLAVDGDYAVSQAVPWLDGTQLDLGSPVSVVIRIGREIDPDDTLFQEASDDSLRPCQEPSYTIALGGAVQPGPDLASSAGVYTPDGGMLNPVYTLAEEPVVLLGARPSLSVPPPGRTADPGLIYAECSDNDGADPGLLYDTDDIRVFWSWYATTAALVQDHLDTAQYRIRVAGQPIPQVDVSEIKRLPGSLDSWVFYLVNFGPKWEPGDYEIEFWLTWSSAISDGYAEFGPGTDNESYGSGCRFTIVRNPYGLDVVHEQPAIPLHVYPWPE